MARAAWGAAFSFSVAASRARQRTYARQTCDNNQFVLTGKCSDWSLMVRVHEFLDSKEAWHLGHRTHTLPTGVQASSKVHTIRFHDDPSVVQNGYKDRPLTL